MSWTMVSNIIKLLLWLAPLLGLYLVPGVAGIDPRCRNVKCTRISSIPACEYSVEYMFEQARRVLVSRPIDNWCCCSKADIRSNQKRKKKVRSLQRCFKEIIHNLNHPPFEFPADECCSSVLFRDYPACKDSPYRTTSTPDIISTTSTPAGKAVKKAIGKAGTTSTTTTKKPKDKTTTKKPKEKSTTSTTTTTTTTSTKKPKDKTTTTTTSTTTTKGPGKSTTTAKASTTTTTEGKSKSSSNSSGDDDENDDEED